MKFSFKWVCFVYLVISIFIVASESRSSNNNNVNHVNFNIKKQIQKDSKSDENQKYNRKHTLPSNQRQEREQLYEAYNLLHTLAQVIILHFVYNSRIILYFII